LQDFFYISQVHFPHYIRWISLNRISSQYNTLVLYSSKAIMHWQAGRL